MITHNDQQNLFRIISNQLGRDITCYAFGGTAMMFYGYKGETKDIDLLLETKTDRDEFVKSINVIGFDEASPFKIYIEEKLRNPNRPLMFKRDDYRFDLFVSKIFQTLMSPKMKKDVFAVHEYKGKHKLTIHILRKEHLVMLKSVAERQNDFDDIRKILTKDPSFDWQYLTDEVLWQYQNGDGWILINMLKTIEELQKYVFVEEKYKKQLLQAAGKKKKKKLEQK